MKKLADLVCYVAIGENEYQNTSIWSHINYMEMDECKTTEFTLNTFNEAYAAIANDRIRNAEIGATLFGKPTIEISRKDFIDKFVMNERTFKPISVKWEWQEVERNYTIKDLANLLPAEQFCEWLKDRGITVVGSH